MPRLTNWQSFTQMIQRKVVYYYHQPLVPFTRRMTGSPFGTGNNTFGFDPLYKRYAALLGDFQFQAPRRAWQQAATKFGVKNYGYLFTDQDAVLPGLPEAGGEFPCGVPSPLITVLTNLRSRSRH